MRGRIFGAWQQSCFIHGVKVPTDKSILLVEDEKLLNWSLEKSLSKWGFDVHPVFTATEAMVRLQKSEYDIVLLDYQLPDLDGLQVARCVRKIRPEAVIFLLTAFQLNEIPVDAGLIDAYFNKPLDFQQLHQALTAACQSPRSNPLVADAPSRV
jgi:DNA-binding response OmpR family regulator